MQQARQANTVAHAHIRCSTLFIKCLEHLSDPTSWKPLSIICLVLLQTQDHNKHDLHHVKVWEGEGAGKEEDVCNE
eukprot:1156915-Pelagomonas_calceolata.AAC.9